MGTEDLAPLIAHVEGRGELELRGRQNFFHRSANSGALTFSTEPVEAPLFVITAGAREHVISSSGGLPVFVNGIRLDAPRPLSPGDHVEAGGVGLTLSAPPPTTRPPAGSFAARRFGRYVLQAELGRGAFGAVYQAHDPELGRLVAIKVLLAPNASTRQRFEREVRATARLRHPHIVAIHDCGEEQERPFLVMDFIEGQTLEGYVDTKISLSPEEAARLVRDLAEAIAFAHGEGILHRDLKPQNVLVDRRGHAYVADFGLARLKELAGQSLTASGHMVGTPLYMPLEQAMGERVDERADVYALGGILYFALTGAPHRTVSGLDELLAAMQRPPSRPSSLRPDVPVALDQICLRALEPEADDRYASADELADDLARFLEGARPSAHRAPELAARVVGVGTLLAGMVAAGAILSRTPSPAPVTPTPSPSLPVGPGSSSPPVGGAPEAHEREQAEPADWVAVQELIESGDWKTVWTRCARIVAQDPDFLPARVARARAGKVLGHADEALADLDHVLSLEPENLEAIEQRARIRIQQGQSDAALSDTRELVARRPDDPIYLYLHGLCLSVVEPALSLEPLRRLLAQQPDNGGAWQALGSALLALDRPEEAIEPSRRAAEALKSVEACLTLAIALRRAGRAEEAYDLLERLKAAKPESSLVRLRSAQTLGLLGRYEESLADYEVALRMRDEDADAWAGAGNCLLQMHRWRDAARYYARALALNRDLTAAWVNRGICYARLKEFAEAERDELRALELDPNRALAWTYLGIARAERGDLDEALVAFDRAITLGEREDDLGQARLGRSKVLLVRQDLPGSLAELDRLLEAMPGLAEAWFWRSRARAIAGDTEGAIEDAERCLASETDPTVREAAAADLEALRAAR